MAQRYSVECDSCGGEGVLFECIDGCCEDCDIGCDDCEYRCGHCEGKGHYVVTQLTDDNYDRAVPINDPPLTTP